MSRWWSRWWSSLWGFLGQRWTIAFSLLVAAVVWAASQWAAPGWLDQLEERSGDLAWRLAADRQDERRLIVVDIDDRSLQEVGPWPWPRATQARLVRQLNQAGTAQQIYDIVFTEPRAGDDVLLGSLFPKTTRDAQPDATQAQPHSPVNTVVLAQVFALEQGGQPSVGKLAAALDWSACPAPFSIAPGYLGNFAALANAAPFAGHITPRVAADGLVRHQPAVICHGGLAYPALGIAAVLAGSGEKAPTLQQGSSWLDAPWILKAPALPTQGVPLNTRGDLRVSWRLHPDSFISLSAADVLAGRIPAGLLDKAWVLVGSTAFGLNDSIASPYSGTTAGLQVHAQVISALIDGRTPYTPRIAPVYQLGAAALGVALLLLLRRKRFAIYLLPLASATLAGLLWLTHALLLTQHAMWMGWANPAFYVAIAGLALGVLEHAKSRLDRDRLYSHLSSYLPAPVAAALALQSPSGAIRASTNQVSVLFADIRNFSAYLDARPPEEAAAVLHAFFSVATQVVQAHGGVIEAFQGDAVLAVWNGDPAPESNNSSSNGGLATPHHARCALDAAVSLTQAIRGVLPDPAPAGLEPLALGIGVETGPAMVGSFGLASRRTHMVMGRTVTIASRLVDMTGELAHPILVGEGLAAQVGAEGLESMGTFLLEGMRFAHHVYAYPLTEAASEIQ